jgi:DNA recombination protein RmuC
MDILALSLAALLVLALIAAAMLWTRGRGDRERLAALGAELAQERERVTVSQTAIADALAVKAAAETRLAESQRLAAMLSEERDAAAARRDVALAESGKAASELAVMRQRLADNEARMADFERVKAEGLQAMQAAALQTTQLLSSKLLEDHKRENEAAK